MVFTRTHMTQACTVRIQESLLGCTRFAKVYMKTDEDNVMLRVILVLCEQNFPSKCVLFKSLKNPFSKFKLYKD